MKQADQVAWLERMLAMARANTRDDAPGLTYTAVEEYFDEERYDREVALLFRRHPVVVGFSGQLRKPGDFVTNNDTGQPILVTRGAGREAARIPERLPTSLGDRWKSEAVRRRASEPSSAPITAGATISRAAGRHHRRRVVRRDRSQHPRLAAARRRGALRPGLGGADGARIGRERRVSISIPISAR